MSGAFQAESASSLINQCQFIEEQTQGAIVKALRAITGQYKALADTTVNASTTLVTEAEFSFPVKKGYSYILFADLLVSTGATPGFKMQLTAPANTANTTFRGKALAMAGTANIAGVTLADNTHLNASIFSAASAFDNIYIQGLLIPSADDVLTVQFAQSVSNASNTILLRGSWMNLMRLSSSRRAPNVV
jgi:hypothetical protein